MEAVERTTVPAPGFDYYGNYVSWVSFDQVNFHLNRLVSGHPIQNWVHFLRDNHPTFDSALSMNCGNGWVDRELFREGVVREVVGVDIDDGILEEARREAAEVGLPARYECMDVNRSDLPHGPYDLVVNFAALHHVSLIDRVVRGIHRSLAPGGLLVHYDYTGPHRNQYSTEAWSATIELNESLPADLRNDGLCYPHLPTMLAVDPTEAVHSELMLETFGRYFDFETLVPLGGGIAYQLLHENSALHSRRDTSEGRDALERIIAADVELTAGDPARSLFTFAVLTPKAELPGDEILAGWTEQEERRETDAAAAGGRYYPRTAFGVSYELLADARSEAVMKAASLAEANETLERTHPTRTRAVIRRARRRLRGIAGSVVRRSRRLASTARNMFGRD